MTYVYQPYPRMLHNAFGEQTVVKSEEEEKAAAAKGWFADTSGYSMKRSLLEQIEKHEKMIASCKAKIAELEIIEVTRLENAATVDQVNTAEGLTRNIELTSEQKNQAVIDALFEDGEQGVSSEDLAAPADAPAEETQVYQCTVCGRSCASRLGLSAHMRVHSFAKV